MTQQDTYALLKHGTYYNYAVAQFTQEHTIERKDKNYIRFNLEVTGSKNCAQVEIEETSTDIQFTYDYSDYDRELYETVTVKHEELSVETVDNAIQQMLTLVALTEDSVEYA